MYDFGQIFNELMSGKKTPDEVIAEAMKDVAKDKTSELLVDSQRNEIQRLEHKVNYLISVLITITDKTFQKNVEYWNVRADNSYNRIHEQPVQDETMAE